MRESVLSVAIVAALPLLAVGQVTDTAEQSKDVVRQHHARLNRGEVKAAVLDYAEDAMNHGRSVGREGLQRTLDDIYITFPDWRMEIADMVAEGDTVVVRCRVSGTHLGVGQRPINGGMLVGVKPTGKRFEVSHIHWYRVRNGKIAEHYANRDDIGMMRQLGLLPPAASGAANPVP